MIFSFLLRKIYETIYVTRLTSPLILVSNVPSFLFFRVDSLRDTPARLSDLYSSHVSPRLVSATTEAQVPMLV